MFYGKTIDYMQNITTQIDFYCKTIRFDLEILNI